MSDQLADHATRLAHLHAKHEANQDTHAKHIAEASKIQREISWRLAESQSTIEVDQCTIILINQQLYYY